MEFQKCNHFHQFYSYFTLYANQLLLVLKISAQYFGVSALSFHFEREQPSIDVVRSMTPQTIRNYNCVINIM